MSGQIVWQQSNEPTEVEQWLRQAVEVVEAVEVPEDLRELAFAKALDLLSAKIAVGTSSRVTVPQVAPLQ